LNAFFSVILTISTATSSKFLLRGNNMSEDKTTTAKGTVKKVVAVTEAAKPKKAPAAKPDIKAATASKTTTTKTTKTTKTVASAAETANPKKAAAATKATSTTSQKPASVAKAPAKAVSKVPAASKAVATKPAAAPKKKAPAATKLIEKPAAPSPEERQRWVATAAYHRAEKRGFAPGYEVQDWLDAEVEISELVGKA
jgi:hypothetical protein